jgi:hypothetical protein
MLHGLKLATMQVRKACWLVAAKFSGANSTNTSAALDLLGNKDRAWRGVWGASVIANAKRKFRKEELYKRFQAV